jgi:hypothetical protein
VLLFTDWGFFIDGARPMQLIRDWPSPDNLSLPHHVVAVVKQILIEPFGDEESASGFWTEAGCLLAICDDLREFSALPKDATYYRLTQALLESDVVEDLPDSYELLLAITTDSGAGTYLILTPDARTRA